MKVPFLNLGGIHTEEIKTKIFDRFHEIVDNSAFISNKYVESFEEKFAKFVGVKHCIAVNSGTAANHLIVEAVMKSLLGQEFYPNGTPEVLIPCNTFIATAWGALLAGVSPVFVDHDKFFNIDVDRLERHLTENTRFVIAVHLYGQPCNMKKLVDFCNKHNLILLEDCAQAHGATFDDKPVGSFGLLSAFSFYPGKNLGTWGEGGAVCTNDDNLCLFVREVRAQGSSKKYFHTAELGHNYRMSELMGAVLDVKLDYLNCWNNKRRQIAEIYRANLPSELCIPVLEGTSPVYHLFPIILPYGSSQDVFINLLAEKGIQTGIHYPYPLYETKSMELNGYSESFEAFTNSENMKKRIVSLPMCPTLDTEQVKYVCNVVKEVIYG